MKHALLIALIWCALTGGAGAQPPIEAYGELPDRRSLVISPDGKHAAFLSYQDGVDFMAVSTGTGDFLSGMRTDKLKARSVTFAGPDHVILRASETTRLGADKYENSGAFSYNVKTQKVLQIPRWTKGGLAYQTGLGRIVGKTPDGKSVFMPAFTAPNTGDAKYDLYKVDLDSGSGVVVAKGQNDTIDYFVNSNGEVVAREDYEERAGRYVLLARNGGAWSTILERSGEGIPFSILGLTPDETRFVYLQTDDETGYRSAFSLTLDGGAVAPLFSSAEKEIDAVLVDEFRRVIGAEFAGPTPSYEFFDRKLQDDVNALVASREGLSVRIVSWTEDYATLVVLIEGGLMSPAYYRFDRPDFRLTRLASRYSRIADADVGEVLAIEFKARDGLTIPAIVSLPPGVAAGSKRLPAIVMPHGGPEAYDAIGFDWLAQYFANRGYIVLQPNFRGSAGFGRAHQLAGDGEWGGKMQDDITDTLATMVRIGWADGDRACIIGASYGGYAALAGGAFTPDLYKCVAAIAPVTDLETLLVDVERESGRRSLTTAYVNRLIGERRKDKEKIRALSPVNSAETFKAPVLLIHGKDDTVVPIVHSNKMLAALKKVAKPVEFIQLKKEDHWLSDSETRLQILRALDAFVSRHIGAAEGDER